jgi:CRISPR-associated endonuclease/helicase Cas3
MLKAKSELNGALSLLDHTRHVVVAIERIASALGFDVQIARKAAILHDLGKAHPFFQEVIRKKDADEDDMMERLMQEPHRHEISSLLFLPVFPQAEWRELVDLVVAHHKSIKHDSKNRGLLDFVEERYDADWTFERHLEDEMQTWEAWSAQAIHEVLPHFGLSPIIITQEQAREAFDFAVNHCQTKPKGWSELKGLLISADHFASHFGEEVTERIQTMYQIPDLSYYNRTSALHPLSLEKADDPKPHTLLIAPTGAGKTDFLLRRCTKRVFYVLPFQASINAMFNRVDANLNHEEGDAQKLRKSKHEQFDVRHLHSASTFLKADHREAKAQYDEIQLQKHPGAAVKILTPHQLAALAFGTNGHEAMAIDVRGCDVILDEVHVYADFTQSMVVEITKALVRLGCRVHIGSATIPSDLATQLVEVLGGTKHVFEKTLPIEILQTFDRHEIHKHTDSSQEMALVETALMAQSKVLIVSNAVKVAQARFRAYMTDLRFEAFPKLLVHSRFKRQDRAGLEGLIQQYSDANMPCIVCTTQVVEVSLDINFDTMFTDAAPLDALIQRFGRVNRKRTLENIGKLKPIHVFAPPRSTLPYKKALVMLSFEALPEGKLPETQIQALIDQVYRQVEIPIIDLHLFYKNDAFTLKELEHRAKSVLRDQLDIDSIPCIVAADREYYEDWKNRDRFELEIPVPLSVMIKHLKNLEQLKTGHYPFIVPDEWYDPIYGLELPDTYNEGGAFL